MEYHAKYSASTAGSWSECALWARMRERVGKTPPAFVTAKGSVTHNLSDACLKSQALIPEDFRGVYITQDGFEVEIDDDVVAWSAQYIDTLKFLAGENKIFSEMELPLDHITGEEGATSRADAVIPLFADRELIVGDLKTGRIGVSAEGNMQGVMLCSGALNAFGTSDFDTVRFMIIQPSSNNSSEWVMTVDEVLAYEPVLAEAVQRSEMPDAVGTPGVKQCRYCAGKAVCPALENYVFGENWMLETVDNATDNERLANLYERVELVRMWCDSVESEVESRLHSGKTLPGLKLVEGRNLPRKWVDEDKVIELLADSGIPSDDYLTVKLNSPTSLEKALAKANLEVWEMLQAEIKQDRSKPSVAKADDKRKTYSRASDDFSPL